nr:hypothetical protein [uncultured Porphyromonas sp.]
MDYLLISVASALITLFLCERFIIRYYHQTNEDLLRQESDLYDRLGEKIQRNMELRVELYKVNRELERLREEGNHLKEESKRLREELSLHQKQEESLHKELMEQVERQNH